MKNIIPSLLLLLPLALTAGGFPAHDFNRGALHPGALVTLAVSVHTINNPCAGLCDGSAEALVSGGTPPFSFLWNTGATLPIIFPLPTGTYSVTVTDATGCTATASNSVTEPLLLVLDVMLQDTCSGNASAFASATGGTPPYLFEWSHGVTGQAATNLDQGVYFATVTDANGCKKDHQITVSDGVVVVVTGSTPGDCAAGGTASLGVPSGIGPLHFLWSNGATTLDVANLAPGNYSVTVTDGATCTGSTSVEITSDGSGAFETIAQATSGDCGTMSSGSASVTVTSGGMAPFAYLWSNGATSPAVQNLAPGDYSVTVTDAQGCISVATVQVSGSASPSILVQAGNASCHNTADGNAVITSVSAGALPPFSYAWSNGDATDSTGNLLPGNYSVTVTDAQGCSGSMQVAVAANAVIEAEFDAQIVGGCPGDDSMQVQLLPSVFISPSDNPIVSWMWVFNDGEFSSDLPNPLLSVASNELFATLIVENATGCRDTVSHTIQPGDDDPLASFPDSAAGCTGDTLEISGTYNPADSLVFSWNADSITLLGSDTPTPSVVTGAPGNFTIYVTVSDGFGCTLQDSVLVNVANDEAVFDPSLVAFKQCEGLTLDFSNGNPDASAWQWFFDFPDDLNATSTLPNPSFSYDEVGSYTVAFVPLAACLQDTFFLEVSVGEPPVAAFSFEKNECSDSITVAFSDESATPGGILGWHWQFSNGDSSQLQNPLLTLAQNQTLVATLTLDFETGCTLAVSDTLEVNVFNPSLPPDTVLACLPDPTAQLNPGADPSLSYLWTPSAGLDDPASPNPSAATNLTTIYSVLISDSTGAEVCFLEKTVTLLVPPAIGLTTPEGIVACEIYLDTLIAGAAAAPVNFVWSSSPDFGDTLSQSPSLEVTVGAPATWYVQATDVFGCSETGIVETAAFPIGAQVPDFQPVCEGNEVEITIPGIAPGDTLTWSPSDPNGQTLNDTASFILTISNATGCSSTDTLTLNVVNLDHLVSVEPAADTIISGETVQLEVLGNFVHLCSWSPGEGLDDPLSCSPAASPQETTTYTVEVTDPTNGCRGSASAFIFVAPALCEEPMIYVPSGFTPNGDGLNDLLFVRGVNIERILVFAIYDRWGEKVFETTDIGTGWDGSFGSRLVSGDVYAYFLKVLCKTGEEFFKKGNVTVVR